MPLIAFEERVSVGLLLPRHGCPVTYDWGAQSLTIGEDYRQNPERRDKVKANKAALFRPLCHNWIASFRRYLRSLRNSRISGTGWKSPEGRCPSHGERQVQFARTCVATTLVETKVFV